VLYPRPSLIAQVFLGEVTTRSDYYIATLSNAKATKDGALIQSREQANAQKISPQRQGGACDTGRGRL